MNGQNRGESDCTSRWFICIDLPSIINCEFKYMLNAVNQSKVTIGGHYSEMHSPKQSYACTCFSFVCNLVQTSWVMNLMVGLYADEADVTLTFVHCSLQLRHNVLKVGDLGVDGNLQHNTLPVGAGYLVEIALPVLLVDAVAGDDDEVGPAVLL